MPLNRTGSVTSSKAPAVCTNGVPAIMACSQLLQNRSVESERNNEFPTEFLFRPPSTLDAGNQQFVSTCDSGRAGTCSKGTSLGLLPHSSTPFAMIKYDSPFENPVLPDSKGVRTESGCALSSKFGSAHSISCLPKSERPRVTDWRRS